MNPKKPSSKKIRSQAGAFGYIAKPLNGMILLINGRRASGQGYLVRVAEGDRISLRRSRAAPAHDATLSLRLRAVP